MTPLAETIRFVEQVIAQTSFEGQPSGVAIEFTSDGGLYLHLCLEGDAGDDPEEWSHTYVDSEVQEPAIPSWVLEYRRLDEECSDPLQSVGSEERAKLRSIPDPPPTAEALELLGADSLYPEAVGPEGGPLMVLLLNAKIPEAATQEIEKDEFRQRATGVFRCRRITSKCPLFEKHGASNSELRFYSLQAELLASRWLASGVFDDLPNFLDKAIAWSQESVAERKEREVLAERLGKLTERRYQDGLGLCARALSECKEVFYPARLLVCSDDEIVEVNTLSRS
jgi:hypothetical protein